MICPACNENENQKPLSVSIHKCGSCGAVYGDCYKGEVYRHIALQHGLVGGDSDHYVDIVTVGSEGIRRIHGWVDDRNRLVQIG